MIDFNIYVDSGYKSIEEIRDLILDIATGNLECPVGSIDFMEWLLNQWKTYENYWITQLTHIESKIH